MNHSTNQDLPLVSICIPLYNKVKYIERTIQMALGQTYPNLEIVINDNASNDGSDAIVRQYQALDSRIKYHRLDHTLPIYHNWQYVLLSAKGDYLHLLCADDCISSDFIQEMMKPLLENPAIDFTRCNVQPLFECEVSSEFTQEINSGFAAANNFNQDLLSISNKIDRVVKIGQHCGWANYFGSMVCVLFKRSCLPIKDWTTPVGSLSCRSHPDWDILTRIHLNHTGHYLEQNLAQFSYNPSGDALIQQGEKFDNKMRAVIADFLMPFTMLSDPSLSDIRQHMSVEVKSKLKEITRHHLQKIYEVADNIDYYTKEKNYKTSEIV